MPSLKSITTVNKYRFILIRGEIIKGIIIKSQKDIYYVDTDDKIYLCRARGVFRERKIKPLVGDRVEIQVIDADNAYIIDVYPRKSETIRPPVANMDQIMLVQTIDNPSLNLNTLDKYLVMLEHYDIDVFIVINKIDLSSQDEINRIRDIYESAGYDLVLVSAKENINLEALNLKLKNKITAMAGPSGVGKSSLLNELSKDHQVETGKVSRKTSRGKHTTRHSQLFFIGDDTYILDTPGFSSIDISFIDDEREVKKYFREFTSHEKDCRFQDCIHINEPQCAVKKQVEDEIIKKSRYENYLFIYQEIKNKRRY